jgi:perosamine synthetase
VVEVLDIPYTRPSITQLESSYVADAMAHGWGKRCYEYIERFENNFKAYIGTDYAIATSSATGALWLGYAALGITRGDEVIMADINWIATAAPLVHMGVKVVLVDIDPVSWCISPGALEAAISERTKAIVVTHLYGNLADMASILEIGKRYKIPIIEDAAEALGSMHQGSRAGSMGEFGAFSFHGTKTLTTGEGGMLVTNNEDLYIKASTLANHGRSAQETRQFWPSVAGYKFKMSNIQAALGCAQLERVGDLVSRKREIFRIYRNMLTGVTGISMNPESPADYNSYWMPTVVLDPHLRFMRETILHRLLELGVQARTFFWPLSALDFVPSVKDNPAARRLSESGMNLPSFHDIKTTEQQLIVDIFIDTLGP